MVRIITYKTLECDIKHKIVHLILPQVERISSLTVLTATDKLIELNLGALWTKNARQSLKQCWKREVLKPQAPKQVSIKPIKAVTGLNKMILSKLTKIQNVPKYMVIQFSTFR